MNGCVMTFALIDTLNPALCLMNPVDTSQNVSQTFSKVLEILYNSFNIQKIWSAVTKYQQEDGSKHVSNVHSCFCT